MTSRAEGMGRSRYCDCVTQGEVG